MRIHPYVGKVLTGLALASLLVFWTATSVEAEEKVQDVKLRIEKVSLFKNGLGFVVSEASLPDQARKLRLGQLPVPSYGTFWVGYSNRVSLRNMITSLETVETKAGIQNLGQWLQINAGRKAIIHTGMGEKDLLEGIVLPMPGNSDSMEPPSPYFMDISRPQDSYGRYNTSIPPGVVMVKTEKGIVALNSTSIMRVDFEGETAATDVPIKQKRPSIRLELDRPAGGEKISVTYLARGMTWAPSYLIDLSDPKTAQLSAKAVVINELADFESVKLDLVTGFPNIKFGEVLSPTAMSQNLADFLNSLARGRTDSRESGRSQLMQQQAVFANVAGYEEITPLPNYSTATEGMVSEDLFLYPVKEFSLKKGETAWLPLFTAEMPYQHIYTWKIPGFLDKEERYQSSSPRDDDKKLGEEVWHSCRLVNNLKMPLTTAATEFVKEGQFTGQDVCYYTAPGAETTIRINRAMNVLAEQAELEIERKRNAAQFYSWNYDLVKVKGELKVRSRLEKTATLEIVKELSGEVLEKTPAAKDVQTAKGLKQVNPKHVLTWQIELKPGELMSLSYIYQVYIRN